MAIALFQVEEQQMLRRFLQIDVFGDAPFGGNPLAVVLDAEGLSTDEMQRFARWASLSETAFFLPAGIVKAHWLELLGWM